MVADPDADKNLAIRKPTPRQMQILRLVGSGWTNARIARELRISRQTVKNHMTDVFNRVGVYDRVSLVILALKCGWVSLDELEIEVDEWRNCY